MKKIIFTLLTLCLVSSLNAQLKVISNDRASIGSTDLFEGTNNYGFHVAKGGHSSILLGNPDGGNGGIMQVSDDRHRIFIGANVFDDRVNGWSNFQAGKGAAGFNVIADEGDWGASVSIYTSQTTNGFPYQRLTVRGNGNVGIGKMPSYKLDVDGYVRATNITISSDARLKENIKDLQTESKILDLRPVQYNFTKELFSDISPDSVLHKDSVIVEQELTEREKEILSKTQYGFVAQEVEQIFPQLVETDSKGMLSVDYISMIPMLVAELKEQEMKFEDLNKKYEELLTKFNEMSKVTSYSE